MESEDQKACQGKQCPQNPKLVVLTGGPGAGKTAVLELARRNFCSHIAFLPEAASIIFSGGFPRKNTPPGKMAAQHSIFHVQRQLERLVINTAESPVILCDRGTLDGLAYWPDTDESFFAEMGTTREAELSRYAAVIHLRSPSAQNGYNHQNPVRIESAREAALIDDIILKTWEGHPRRVVIESTVSFLEKARLAIQALSAELPVCCQHRPQSIPVP